MSVTIHPTAIVDEGAHLGDGIFIGIAVLGGASMMVGSGAIARGWLKVQQLPLIEVQHAIMLMPFVHNRYAKGLHWPWLMEDVLKVSIPAIIISAVSSYICSNSESDNYR
jgi:hypothetical protein